MICPTCAGAATVTGLVNWSDPRRSCSVETLPCFRCGGTGEVPDEQAAWIRKGEGLRARRRAAGGGPIAFPRALGFSPTDWLQAESGWRDPTPYLVALDLRDARHCSPVKDEPGAHAPRSPRRAGRAAHGRGAEER